MQMIIMILFIFGCSEYGMPLFLAIYKAKQCPPMSIIC